MTPTQVEEAIEACLHELEEHVDKLRHKAKNAAEAEVAFKVAFSQARLKEHARLIETGSGRAPAQWKVDDFATLATRDEQLTHRIWSNALLTEREALRATQARLDGLRTLSASHRNLT